MSDKHRVHYNNGDQIKDYRDDWGRDYIHREMHLMGADAVNSTMFHQQRRSWHYNTILHPDGQLGHE